MDASHRDRFFPGFRICIPGASGLARRHDGTPVFGGMIFASFGGIFAIPPLYVFLRAIRERPRPGAQSWKVRRQSKFSEGRF